MAPKGRGRKIANVTDHIACHNLAENDQEKLVGLPEKKGPLKRLRKNGWEKITKKYGGDGAIGLFFTPNFGGG